MTKEPYAWPGIPMPTLLRDDSPSFSNRDPETSGDAGPIYSDAERDAARPDVDEPISDYARQLWRTLNTVVQYLREDVARGGAGPVQTDQTPLLTTDDQWQAWMKICAAALHTLAGPAGDQGYGEQEARLEYQNYFVYRDDETASQ
jgi:hypothetical protein